MTLGTNDFNRYTLFEFFGTLWSRKFEGEPTLPFPDLANVSVVRVDPKSSTNRTIQVDLEALVRAGDCSKDIWLDWGDRVVVPELDHPIVESWKGPSPEIRNVLSQCMTRRIQIVVKNTTNMVTLTPPYLHGDPSASIIVPFRQNDGSFGFGPGGAPSKPLNSTRSTNCEQTLFTFLLKPVVIGSGLLRASSDTTRVRVSRLDQQTNERKQWTIDLTSVQLPSYDPRRNADVVASVHDLWLRDGDVIEIPEKREPFATTQATGPAGRRPVPPAPLKDVPALPAPRSPQ